MMNTSSKNHMVPGTCSSSSASDTVLGPAPSQLEADSAIRSFRSLIMEEIKAGSRQIPGLFCRLLSDPTVQELVAALVTDEAVWVAVKMNKMMQKLMHQAFPSDGRSFGLEGASSADSEWESDDDDPIKHWLRWITDMASVVKHIIKNWKTFTGAASRPAGEEGSTSSRGSAEPPPPPSEEDEKTKESLLLAVIIFVMVVVARILKMRT
ncbi:hypothetical protein LINGRAHAP2_LOCUS28564 [Linum grandiflorum]